MCLQHIFPLVVTKTEEEKGGFIVGRAQVLLENVTLENSEHIQKLLLKELFK